jgi:hypothetical protein
MPSLSLRPRRSWSRTTLTLPQTTTPLAVTAHQSSGGHSFGLIHAQATGHYTVCLNSVAPLDRWAALLAYPALDVGGHASDVVAITAVADTFPTTADAYRRWRDGTDDYPSAPIDPDELGLRTHLAVTFAAATTDTRRFVEEMGVEVGRRLPTLIGSLAAARLPTTPLTAPQIAAIVAEAYREETSPDIAFADAGPTDTPHRVRTLFCHDGFVSSSWVVAPHVLDADPITALLRVHPTTPRRRLSVTWRRTRIADELPTDDPTHVTFIPTLARFGALTTVTEPHARTPSLDAVRAELPLYARLGLRPAFDRHAELFAGGLGVGVLLPEHSELSDEPLRHRHRTA